MDDVMEMEATDLGEVEPAELPEEAPEPEEPEEGAEDESDEEQPEEEDAPEEEEKPTEEAKAETAADDGRKMPDAVKKAFALLNKSNPEAAKTLRAQWFQNRDFRTVFPTPADAIALKEQYEEIGGAEGVKQMVAERAEWGEVDKAVAEGRAAELLAHNPEVLVKNAVGVVNEWAKTAPDQYRFYTDQVTVNTMQRSGVPTELAGLHKSLGDFITANPELRPYLTPFQEQVAGAYNKIAEISERAHQFQQKRTDPAQEKLQQDRERFETERRADFEGRVAGEAESYLGTAVDKAVQTLLNGRKADDDQMAIYRDKVMAEVQNRLGQIPGFGDNLEAHYRTGNRQQSVDYIKKQYDRILTSGKAANVIEPLLRNINPQKAAATAKPTGRVSEAGTITLPEMPDWDKVDWNRTTSAEYAGGKAVLVNGKQARW